MRRKENNQQEQRLLRHHKHTDLNRIDDDVLCLMEEREENEKHFHYEDLLMDEDANHFHSTEDLLSNPFFIEKNHFQMKFIGRKSFLYFNI